MIILYLVFEVLKTLTYTICLIYIYLSNIFDKSTKIQNKNNFSFLANRNNNLVIQIR